MIAISNVDTNLKARSHETLERIDSMLRLHRQLGRYLDTLDISIENGSIVLRGELPSEQLRSELVPMIRRAGILCQISNEVQVA
ncbi:MAG: hypothetical protein ACF788_08880 [Novipirellula sp. JB048]